jgi:nitrile hydratase
MGAISPERIVQAVMAGGSARRGATGMVARFKAGDAVIARDIHPDGHTRLPRYARGKPGVIDRIQGVFVLPDSNARLKGEQPGTLYAVRFEAADLWGDDAGGKDAFYVDLWDVYLDPA